MRKLTISINVTLDGCCDHTQVVADEELMDYATSLLRSATAILLGRVTHEMFRDYWPAVARGASPGGPGFLEWARELDGKRKFVLTRGGVISGWDTSVVSLDNLPSAQAIAGG